jgi:hypothetical protein
MGAVDGSRYEALGSACFRSGEIRILKSNGTVERIIPFDETQRRL